MPSLVPSHPPRLSGTDVLKAEFLTSSSRADKLTPPTLPEVAFSGRSNVGKSSLLNSLMQRKRLARTSNTPGRTQQVNLFALTLRNGLSLHLVDLPGYGYAKVSKTERRGWQPLIEGYLLHRPVLRGMVLLLDVRRGLEEDDIALIRFVESRTINPEIQATQILVVATKIDQIPPSHRKPALHDLRNTCGQRVLGFSAKTGEGREELLHALRPMILPSSPVALSTATTG